MSCGCRLAVACAKSHGETSQAVPAHLRLRRSCCSHESLWNSMGYLPLPGGFSRKKEHSVARSQLADLREPSASHSGSLGAPASLHEACICHFLLAEMPRNTIRVEELLLCRQYEWCGSDTEPPTARSNRGPSETQETRTPRTSRLPSWCECACRLRFFCALCVMPWRRHRPWSRYRHCPPREFFKLVQLGSALS